MTVQLEGNITLGGNDHADDVYALTIRGTRPSNTQDGTFADADPGSVLGGRTFEVVVEIDANEGDAAAVWLELWTAFLSDSGDLAFTANITTGATSATNPVFAGTLKVNNIEAMGKVGDDKRKTLTFPAINVTRAES